MIIMRCISCENFSVNIICNRCQSDLLKPSFYRREIEDDFFVYSFYQYDDVKDLLNTKYEFYGDKVFNILAKLAFKEFAQSFSYTNQIKSIAIDDHTRHHFSHTSILSKHLNSKYIKPVHDTLKAMNVVKYAGKDLEFRQNNKRDFQYTGKENQQVILVDDVVTTGTTILEAKDCLQRYNCEVLFAITLSDVKLS